MLTVVPLGGAEPPFGLVTTQEIETKFQPDGTGVSLTVYVVKVVMFENSLVFAEVPS